MQTGDSNLDANKTINSCHKEKVLQGQDIGSPTSNLAVEVVVGHEVSCSFAGGFVSKRSLLQACFDNDGDTVVPRTGTLDDKSPSLLSIPVDGSGEPLLSCMCVYVYLPYSRHTSVVV